MRGWPQKRSAEFGLRNSEFRVNQDEDEIAVGIHPIGGSFARHIAC